MHVSLCNKRMTFERVSKKSAHYLRDGALVERSFRDSAQLFVDLQIAKERSRQKVTV